MFFFQAEDGIRDHCVTGVQTCALPISVGQIYVANAASTNHLYSITVYAAGATGDATPAVTIAGGNTGLNGPTYITFRSEERRVGKVGRTGRPSSDRNIRDRAHEQSDCR